MIFADARYPSSAKASGGRGKTLERLKALKTAKNGFDLAELDLTLRGAVGWAWVVDIVEGLKAVPAHGHQLRVAQER